MYVTQKSSNLEAQCQKQVVKTRAMTTEIPDIRNLEKWEDAFQYPVPTTRAIEKRLRSNLNENHDKLRTLVG